VCVLGVSKNTDDLGAHATESLLCVASIAVSAEVPARRNPRPSYFSAGVATRNARFFSFRLRRRIAPLGIGNRLVGLKLFSRVHLASNLVRLLTAGLDEAPHPGAFQLVLLPQCVQTACAQNRRRRGNRAASRSNTQKKKGHVSKLEVRVNLRV